ncbi:MAG TPA: zf-HC2 domain-containing protein [Sedimentisphaerales bacterium]|nr:zf-HC2 domain-containing protein [Phycisphaerae bacterium]HQG48301.1 zf-HC2 domain-containing protein [Sedimentisphaerales bacterium]HQI27987.1 zf-HC2 domain-containing protein [Sedimentisphaerales bacterium]
MTCQNYRDSMMAYLDNELNEEHKRAFEDHLASCADCTRDLAEFRKLKAMTDGVAFVEPEDRVWEQYWGNVYNRIERGIGWILVSVAAIALLIYGGFEAIESIILDPTLGIFLKIGLLALLGGGVILFVSVLRERVYFWSRDRYRDVRR